MDAASKNEKLGKWLVPGWDELEAEPRTLHGTGFSLGKPEQEDEDYLGEHGACSYLGRLPGIVGV